MLQNYDLSKASEVYPGVLNHRILDCNKETWPFNTSIITIYPNSCTKLHNHHDFELIIILSGNGEIKLDGRSFMLKPKDVLKITPFNYHIITNTSHAENLILISCWQAKNDIKSITEVKNLEKNTIVIYLPFQPQMVSFTLVIYQGHLLPLISRLDF